MRSVATHKFQLAHRINPPRQIPRLVPIRLHRILQLHTLTRHFRDFFTLPIGRSYDLGFEIRIVFKELGRDLDF